MNRQPIKRSRAAREQKASQTMMLVFAAVFFLGLFLQIAMAARIAGQNKQIQALEVDMRDWGARVDNLELCLSQYKSLDRVAEQAAKLGMELPGEGQIRVVNVPEIVEDTSAQSAGAGAGN